jgi:adenylyltransferase/sulfurtransferase
MPMNDEQLLRYSRQIMLPDIDVDGQEKLLDSSVLIIGMGGLGAPVTLYLAAAGIGTLTLVDFDDVELSNLQRQIIHSTQNISQPKVESASQSARTINPEIQVKTINRKLDFAALLAEISHHDVILDCSDNFETRFAINRACVKAKKPLVSGAVVRMEGQITTFDVTQPDEPCYRCLYAEEGEIENTCSTTGILAPVAGIIGSIQATEAIKIMVGLPTLAGRLMILDAKYMEWRSIRLKKDPACPVCSQS